jgi:hypothetical protein
MAGDWTAVCAAAQTGWNIPAPALAELSALKGTAASALETAKTETTRTPAAAAQCKEAFDALTAFMRDFKRRYFLSPPLLDSDYVSLGLKPHDPAPTPAESADKGCRIWYAVVAPGETPPAKPEELRTSFFTRRKKDVIEFDFGDSGKTAYFAVQVENESKKGPWGPLVQALIP